MIKDGDGKPGCILNNRPSVVTRRKGDWRIRCIEDQVHVVERLSISQLGFTPFCTSNTAEGADRFWDEHVEKRR